MKKYKIYYQNLKKKNYMFILDIDPKNTSDNFNFDDPKNIRNTNLNEELVLKLKEIEKKDYLIFRMGKNVDLDLLTSNNFG